MMVNTIAPNFTAEAYVNGQIKEVTLHEIEANYTVLFFYPLDFTFVCPTEMHALQEQMDSFKALGAEVLAISVDSVHSHWAWADMPKNKGGIAGVEYPLVSDLTKNIARSYGVLDETLGLAYRATFILDADKRVQHASINNLPVGRNIGEYLRLIKAFDMHKKEGSVCPANWTEKDVVMTPTRDGVVKYFNQ